MSAKSMASIPRMLQPRCSAKTLPNAESANISIRALRARTVAIPVVLDVGIRVSSSFNSVSYGYPEFMPDLLWSGWVCLATPTLPPDASGSLLAATVTPSALPVLQSHFSSHLLNFRSLAGGSRQGV